jgi:hypothetical protein
VCEQTSAAAKASALEAELAVARAFGEYARRDTGIAARAAVALTDVDVVALHRQLEERLAAFYSALAAALTPQPTTDSTLRAIVDTTAVLDSIAKLGSVVVGADAVLKTGTLANESCAKVPGTEA